MEGNLGKLMSSKRLGKETFIYLPVFLAPAIVNILMLSLFTSMFSPGDYGVYSLVVNTTIIISSFMGQWIVLSVQRFRPEYRKEEKIGEFNLYLNHLLLRMIVLFIFASIIIYFFIPASFRSYYLPSIISIISSVYFMVLASVYQIDLLSKQFRNLNVISAVGKLPIALILLYLVSFTPEQFIWGSVLIQLLILYPMLRHVEARNILTFTKKHKESYRDYIQKFLTYGFPLIGWYVGTTILNLTDRYMIQFFKGAYEVGIYSANFTIAVQAIALVCNPFFFAIQPIIMNQANIAKEKTEQSIAKFTKIYMMLAVPFGIYFSLVRHEISGLLLGEQFHSGAVIIPILVAGFFFWNLGLYGQLCCQVDKRTQHMFYFVIIAAIVNIVLNLLLIPLYGFVGASISTGIGFFIYMMLIYLSSLRHTKWNVAWLAMLKIVMLGIVIAIPFEYIRTVSQINPVLTMFILLIYFPLYAGVLILFKEINIGPIISMLKSGRR